MHRFVWAIVSFGCVLGCGRLAAPSARAPSTVLGDDAHARQLLCGDIGDDACLAACPASRPSSELTECLLHLRFASDPEAFGLARALYAETNTLVGVDAHGTIDGYRGEDVVELLPALPVGAHRHHLEWLRGSLHAFGGFVAWISERAERPVLFDPRPRALAFYRTASPSYPSAYCWDGVISYNLEGPLHGTHRSVHETLFHELFHLNDARRDSWSTKALGPIFDSIVERCGADHECLTPYAPHDSMVPDGTYYAFDERTRHVREYAAELALRYFVEHEMILNHQAPATPPFKCRTAENRVAWERLAEEFFAGVDRTPECDATAAP